MQLRLQTPGASQIQDGAGDVNMEEFTMKRFLVPTILILSLFLALAITACGGDNSSSTTTASKATGGGRDTDGDDGVTYTGSVVRVDTYCFNGKCSTCNTTDKITLTLNGSKVQITAEGPVLTFPSCATETGVSNSEWTLQGTYSGSDAASGGAISVTGCKGDTVTGAKWQGSGGGSIENGNSVKADFQCIGTDEASSGESDKAEWKGVVLNRQ